MTSSGQTIARLAGGLAIALSFLAGQAGAQVTEAQKDAVRTNCRSDFIANCRGVTPGGIEALNCLKEHEAKLAPAYRKAVDAVHLPR
jgi:hypothetical protein